MKNKNKLIILSSIIVGVLVGILGLTYAVLSYNETGLASKLVLGDIWMKYSEGDAISLQGALPGDPYSDYFEFTITGTNTYEEKDIWYEIILKNGEVPEGKLEENRIKREYLDFKLVEVVNETEEKLLFEGYRFHNDNDVIYLSSIKKGTSKYNKTYRLYMRIIPELEIVNEELINNGYCNGLACITSEEYENLFASVKIEVKGDLNLKQMPRTIARLGTNTTKFWSDDIINVKDNIKKVSFLQLDNSEIDTRYGDASIKSDLTTVEGYEIKAWLEENDSNSSTYTMYVASEDKMYFPSDSSYMFYYFSNVEIISFDNIDTSQVTSLEGIFAATSKLKEINGLEKFDTSNVIVMACMFQDSALERLDLSSFDTSNVKYLNLMFCNCKSLKSLNLSSWNTSKVVSMRLLFYGCSNLEILDIINFTFNGIMSNSNNYLAIFFSVGSNLPSGTYTTVYVKPNYVLDGVTYSPKNWILSLSSSNKPSGWSTTNVIVKQ